MKKILFVVMTIGCLVACQEPPKKPETIRPVYAIEVQESSNFPRRAFPGKAQPVEQANVSFGVDGTLKKLPINVGDEVTKGTLLAQLNQRDFISRLNAAKAELVRNQRNLKRAEELLQKDFISRAEYDRIFAAVEMSQSRVEVAQKAVEDSTIEAPFDGVITEKFVENYEAVRSKQVIARILDISDIEMVIQIPEFLINRIRYVKTVAVIFDTFPDVPFEARIKEIGREASTNTRTFPVTLIMPQNKEYKILPGMAGMARAKDVADGAQKQQILIPVGALFAAKSTRSDHVWRVEQGMVYKTKVELGSITSQGAYIKSGLKAGDVVVVAGVHSLQEGQKVKMMKELPL